MKIPARVKYTVAHGLSGNPASEAETVRYDIMEGKTLEISANQYRAILGTIDTANLVGLRDRIILLPLTYTWTHVGTIAAILRHDYYDVPGEWMLHFEDKWGKSQEIPVAYELNVHSDEYLERSGKKKEKRTRSAKTADR